MGMLFEKAGRKACRTERRPPQQTRTQGYGINFPALAGMFQIVDHRVSWGNSFQETRFFVVRAEGPGPWSSNLDDCRKYWYERQFPFNDVGLCCLYARELANLKDIPAGTVAAEIAAGAGGEKVAEHFVSEYFEGGDIDGAHIKAELFGVPHDVYERVFKRAQDMGAGE